MQKKCDRCGEDIVGAMVKRQDGEWWCLDCTRKEMNKHKKDPKLVKTRDPFVLLARRLRALPEKFSPGSTMASVMLVDGRPHKTYRAYTNGQVLLMEDSKIPTDYRLIDLDSLTDYVEEDRTFPRVEGILERVKNASDKVTVTIPKDFYEYAAAFRKPKPELSEICVEFTEDCIKIIDTRDDSCMHYREFSAPGLGLMAYDYAYITALEPAEIEMCPKEAGRITKSYNAPVDACQMVLVMPKSND